MPYLFGDYTLDTRRCELRPASRRIPLRPKVFDVLHSLIARRDRVVSQQELLEQLWPEQFVGDITAQREPPESASAETHYLQALTLANELGMRPLQAHCHHSLVPLYAEEKNAPMTEAHDIGKSYFLPALSGRCSWDPDMYDMQLSAPRGPCWMRVASSELSLQAHPH